MSRYLLRRLLQAGPLLVLISVAVFVLINIVPGGPTAAYENNPRLTSEDLARIEHELGLDQPIHVRYLHWLGAPFSVRDRIVHLLLPVAMLTLATAAQYVRYMRASMLEVIHEDYIRTARAKGAAERRVIWRHAFKNAALPLVTIVALDLPALFSGALFTETIFSWPGMGRLFFDSALRFDYALLMGIIIVNAALIILSNLAADLVYGALDPRLKFV